MPPEKFSEQNQVSNSSGAGRADVAGKKRGRADSHLVEKPCGEDHLEQVVDYQGVFKLEGFPILHELRPEHLHDVDVGETDEQRGKG